MTSTFSLNQTLQNRLKELSLDMSHPPLANDSVRAQLLTFNIDLPNPPLLRVELLELCLDPSNLPTILQMATLDPEFREVKKQILPSDDPAYIQLEKVPAASQDSSVISSSSPSPSTPAARPSGHTKGPKPGSHHKSTLLRRPQNTSTTAYYGLSVRDEQWAETVEQRKRALMHVGRIEETGEGVVREIRCLRCRERGFAVCRGYSIALAKETRVYRCGRCLYDGKKCV